MAALLNGVDVLLDTRRGAPADERRGDEGIAATWLSGFDAFTATPALDADEDEADEEEDDDDFFDDDEGLDDEDLDEEDLDEYEEDEEFFEEDEEGLEEDDEEDDDEG